MNFLLFIGLLLNCGMILVNRYVKQVPDIIYIPLMIVGIGCMIAGAFLAKQ